MKLFIRSIINKFHDSIGWNVALWTLLFYGMMLLILFYLLKVDLSSAPDFVYNQFWLSKSAACRAHTNRGYAALGGPDDLTRVRIPAVLHNKKKGHRPFFLLRRRWDSNPRVPKDKLISSQPRYDHFDTSPHNRYLTILHEAAKNRKSGADRFVRII